MVFIADFYSTTNSRWPAASYSPYIKGGNVWPNTLTVKLVWKSIFLHSNKFLWCYYKIIVHNLVEQQTGYSYTLANIFTHNLTAWIKSKSHKLDLPKLFFLNTYGSLIVLNMFLLLFVIESAAVVNKKPLCKFKFCVSALVKRYPGVQFIGIPNRFHYINVGRGISCWMIMVSV